MEKKTAVFPGGYVWITKILYGRLWPDWIYRNVKESRLKYCWVEYQVESTSRLLILSPGVPPQGKRDLITRNKQHIMLIYDIPCSTKKMVCKANTGSS